MTECAHERVIPFPPCMDCGSANRYSVCIGCGAAFTQRTILEPIGRLAGEWKQPEAQASQPRPVEVPHAPPTIDPREDLRRLDHGPKPTEPVESFAFDKKWRRVE